MANKKREIVGPLGGTHGTYWDDGECGRIKKITIYAGDPGGCIDSIQVVYEKKEALKHGGNGGNKQPEIKLKDPEEKIVKASGHYGTCEYGLVVRSLKFVTNKDSEYGPYGTEEGTPFVVPIQGGHITGFVGRSGQYVNALGFRIAPGE